MIKSGIFGIGLLAYASWQTVHFLSDTSQTVWAKQRFHRYLPRPTSETLKNGKSCRNCLWFRLHPDFIHAGECAHHSWKMVMKSDEVLVKRDGHCELWEKSASAGA